MPAVPEPLDALPAAPLPADPLRAGYDPTFLGPDLPLPGVGDRAVRVLPYVHFTVLLDPLARLAVTTAVNVDGAALVDLGRGDDWHLDDRVPAAEQAGPEVYARNDLDRGHLVRRRDPVWGPRDVAERANRDTFAYPNAAPQASGFNQSAELWLGLEDHVLEHARVHRLRLSVVTGPVAQADDPPYRGVLVPRLFAKVVAWADDETGGDGAGGLRAAAFLLDQSPQLDEDELRRGVRDDGGVPPLGPFRTFQVPVGDVERLAGIDLGPLARADVLAAVPTVRPGSRRLLSSLDDVFL